MTKDRGASTLDLSGRHVGSSYILQRPIGQGATGTVWRGTDLSTGHPVAIKLLHESLLRQPKLVTRFVQERTILLMLRHRNVVRVRDLFSVGETLGLVMDLVSGGSLRDHLRRHHTVPAGEAARLAAQVAAALTEAHELGVVHRDLKPDNILLQAEEGRLETRLTDFGVARILNTPSMTTPNAVVGTPHYMSPEAFHSPSTSPATDVYALGVLLYEMVTGRPPYDSDSIPDLMRRHMEGKPDRPAGIPEGYWEAIKACMALKPRLRPSAAELVADLSDLSQEAGDWPALPAPGGPRIEPNPPVAESYPPIPGSPPKPAVSVVPDPGEKPGQARNQAPGWRWARPGATMTVIALAMLASAVATTAWNYGHGDASRGPAAAGPAHAAPAARVSHRATPRLASSPLPSASRTHAAGTAGSLQAQTSPSSSVRAKHPATAARHGAARLPQPEARAYGPLQCSRGFAFDLSSRTPLGPVPCQMVGRDIRYQASLIAPGGATGSISISLQDAGSGHTVAGPKTCNGLSFDGEADTAKCGPGLASPPRGHQYAVVMAYRYVREGRTVMSTARGRPFTW
ncbi:protein kinase [Actinoplanes sp. NPDC051343]|uniref:serine/threonine-protein kinase n=1 Tax=Actinoplanes sp. NPDC051343 TaxID=3363906 RepID=UPI0037A1B7A9